MNQHFSPISRHFVPCVLLILIPCCRPADARQPAGPKVVQVALCLDTSSSMDGLIDSAKRKLWDVVNDLAKAKPTPDLRVALYSYGNNAYDPKTGWVRQEIDLTADLDRVADSLFALRATTVRGGDEYVARVCREAVERLRWSDDARALKVIFVCGNESAEQDPQVKLKAVAEAAVRKGIILNTIYCGSPQDQEALAWREFARLGEGRFAAIDQDRGIVTIATQHDKELTELGGKLNNTYCFAGRDGKALADNQRKQDENALKAGGGHGGQPGHEQGQRAVPLRRPGSGRTPPSGPEVRRQEGRSRGVAARVAEDEARGTREAPQEAGGRARDDSQADRRVGGQAGCVHPRGIEEDAELGAAGVRRGRPERPARTGQGEGYRHPQIGRTDR